MNTGRAAVTSRADINDKTQSLPTDHQISLGLVSLSILIYSMHEFTIDAVVVNICTLSL